MTEQEELLRETLIELKEDVNEVMNNLSNDKYDFHIEKTRTTLTPRPFTADRVLTQIEIVTPNKIWQIERKVR